ncbi:MAG: FlgD immunoglobulin-like domain containing protein [Bacteroidota bacterium]|nr:FlgD immunoglobulin-like domain containing protein [Bacteroidota bacterium]
MKLKFLLLIPLFIITSITWANPIDNTPNLKFSELVFDANNNWTIELIHLYPSRKIDSVFIKVGDVSAKLNITYRVNKDSCTIYVINADSLSRPLSINPSGDKIYLYTYSPYNEFRSDSTIFGDYPGSKVSRPLPGFSICKVVFREFKNFTDAVYISNKPSIGIVNNVAGLGKKMTGHIYDKDNKLVTHYRTDISATYFELHLPLLFNQDGTYSTTIYPVAYAPDSVTINQLSVRMDDFNMFHRTQDIKPIKLSYANSDTVIVCDIHLLSNENVASAVQRNEIKKNNELTVINYPNPFNSSTNFFVKFPDDLREKSGMINIYNSAGRLIRTISAKDGSTSLWDGKDMNGNTASSGRYYYQINVQSQVLKSGSMILLK